MKSAVLISEGLREWKIKKLSVGVQDLFTLKMQKKKKIGMRSSVFEILDFECTLC